MPFPKKALQYGQLIFKAAAVAVPTSGHEVSRVEFVDADGEIKTGFYKPLEPTYPSLLAKISVAYGVLLRMCAGTCVAEDRLVLDKKGNILGTLSYAFTDFMPMLCSLESLLSDVLEQELRCPSEETLLRYNFTEVLTIEYRSDNNDGHPGNVGYARDEVGCRLIKVLEDPETIAYDRLRELLDKKPAYVLCDSKVYYVDGFFNKKLLETSDFQQLETVFPEEYNQLIEASKDDLSKITALVNHTHEDPLVPVVIDHDMRGSRLTSLIKGPRVTAGITEEIPANVIMQGIDFKDFPIINGRTYWSANGMPGNMNFLKRFMAYAQFQGLAKNPVLQTAAGVISFQDQLFYSLLKHLLLYDPEMLKSWLFDYLGDFPLDFLSLEPTKRQQLSEAYPELFNTETDVQPFVNCIAAYFELEYKLFYEAVVHFPGCEKNSLGVPVIGTNQYLQNKPSAFRDILAFADEQNKLMDKFWQKYEERNALQAIKISEHIVFSEQEQAPLNWFCIPPGRRYDHAKLERRYHQIWRDSHLCMVKEIIFVSDRLLRNLSKELRLRPLSELANQPNNNAGYQSISSSWHLLDERAESQLVSLDCRNNNSMHTGLTKLNTFINQLHMCSKIYYSRKKDYTNLLIEDNENFCNAVSKLILKYSASISKKLSSTLWAHQFEKIVGDLQQYYGRLNLQAHLLEKDIELGTKTRYDYPAILRRQHTDEEIMGAAIKVLFDWVKKENKDKLNAYILEIMALYYEPSAINFTANRCRAEEIKSYLKTSTESGDNKLGRILAETGSGQKSTSLNTLLIRHLLPIVLKNTLAKVNVNLMSVSQAFEAKVFKEIFYTKYAVEYAQKDARFTHSYSENHSNRFNDIIYHWVSELTRPAFKDLITLALGDYEPYGFNFFSGKKRGGDVRKYLNNSQLSNQKILAFIFSEGEIKESSLNTILLNHILNAIKKQTLSSPKAREDHNLQWIMEVNLTKESQFNHYLYSLQKYAKNKSHALDFDCTQSTNELLVPGYL